MEQQHPYPNFKAALLRLGATNRERAERLGVSERTLAYYLRGVMLPPVEKVKQFPEVDQALTLDIRPDMVQIPA
jgi:transcriptional regulator with XRE-family HTH domain